MPVLILPYVCTQVKRALLEQRFFNDIDEKARQD
jgi:hypothetical protein